MQLLTYILIYPLVWLLSLLPMRVLYILSDGLYGLFYYIIGYRKKIVLNNLQLAFPEKELSELKSIQKKFFKHFTDLFVESIKAFTMSEKNLRKRYTYTNPEVINDLHKKGRSIALFGAHQANWEWSIGMPSWVNIKCFAAYNVINNKYFEKTVKKSRTRFGFTGYLTIKTVNAMKTNFDNNIQGLYLLLSDQSPVLAKTHYWSEFMGIKVPIHTGAEMLAKKFDLAAVHYSVKKIKRGRFEVTFETITETPKEFGNYEITDKYLVIVERNIRANPEHYLWSHRRFKHRNKVPKEWQ
ncbi:MAG: lipid A biosynthesis acyltransferase [Flavobacteriaceae bacterium]